MSRMGFLCIVLSVLGVWILPSCFPEALEASLTRLHLPADLAIIYFCAMLVGSAVNLPFWRFETKRFVCADPLSVLGLEGLFPHWTELRKHCVLALNLGGFAIPGAIAIYELVRIAAADNPDRTLIAVLLASCVNVGVSWRLARAVPCVGFAVPGLITTLVAATSALLLKSSDAPPIAFVAGWLGPVLGTGLKLHTLKDHPTATASLGGAGTFGAVLLNSVVSAFLSPGAPV